MTRLIRFIALLGCLVLPLQGMAVGGVICKMKVPVAELAGDNAPAPPCCPYCMQDVGGSCPFCAISGVASAERTPVLAQVLLQFFPVGMWTLHSYDPDHAKPPPKT